MSMANVKTGGRRGKSVSLLTLVSRLYFKRLESNPLITKAVTAGCITALSNYISQRLMGNGRHIQMDKVSKFMLFGLLWAGPSSHYWQNLLEKIVPQGIKESRSMWAIRKTIVDQLVYGPVANAVFLTFMGRVIEQKNIPATIAKVVNDFWYTQINGWAVWPLASVVNQFFVPLQLRVLWLNVVGLFWSTWLMMYKRSS